MEQAYEETTVLRVRRRRNAITSQTLQVEGLEIEEDAPTWPPQPSMENMFDQQISFPDESKMGSNSDIVAPAIHPAKRRRSSVWKKIENPAELVQTGEHATSSNSGAAHPNNLVGLGAQVLEAILHEASSADDEGETPKGDAQQERKRRKLTIVNHSRRRVSEDRHTKQKRGGYKILSPLERLVDDSLQKVYSGEKTARDHYNFCIHDPRLASFRWLSFSNEQFGNILHACALWNDSEMASDLLSLSQISTETLVEGLDAEHRTPYEIADLCGHTSVKEVFEAFGADAAYVYDVYYLDKNEDQDVDASNTMEGLQDRILCEMRNDCSADRADLLVHQDRGETQSISSEADSNHEDWDGNDYPDDDDDDWNSVDGERDGSFRNSAYPVDFM